MKKKLLYETPDVQTTVIQFEKHLMEGSIEGTLDDYIQGVVIEGGEIWV